MLKELPTCLSIFNSDDPCPVNLAGIAFRPAVITGMIPKPIPIPRITSKPVKVALLVCNSNWLRDHVA